MKLKKFTKKKVNLNEKKKWTDSNILVQLDTNTRLKYEGRRRHKKPWLKKTAARKKSNKWSLGWNLVSEKFEVIIFC